MPMRRMSVAGLVGLGLLAASLIPQGPALAFDAGVAGEWPPPEHHWTGPGATPGPAAYDDPAYDSGQIFGFDLTPEDCAGMQRRNQAMGGLLGGVVGGLIGSGIGKGSGKTAATISGALLGAFGGAMLGNKVAEAGEACLPDPELEADRLGHHPTPLFEFELEPQQGALTR